ncbi:MAG TPA: histidine kinase, partial [Solibacterales bacterium]|nr:histidine kinase [Bryobacterales bacterium]
MKELKEQIVNALLVILTVAAVICAGINYQQQRKYALPDDGATWMEVPAEKPGEAPQVTVVHLTPGGPAEVAGIRKGDVLYRIGTAVNPNGMAVEQGIDVAKILARIGVWGKAEYSLRRGGVDLKALVIISDANQDRALSLQYLIGIAWLGIGLFLFFRRQRAPKSLHFFLLCLASFVLHTFHYTGKLNGFDTAIYLGNMVAGLLAPALFIHFCLTFPEPRKQRTAWQTLGVYL